MTGCSVSVTVNFPDPEMVKGKTRKGGLFGNKGEDDEEGEEEEKRRTFYKKIEYARHTEDYVQKNVDQIQKWPEL